MTTATLLQLLISGLSVGSIYALVALALVIPFKASGVLNFGQGEVVLVGAYIALALSLAGLSYPAVVVLTLIIAGLLGIAMERVFVRPLIRAPEFTIVIGTFAVGLLLKSAVRLIWQDNVFSLPTPFPTQSWIVGGVRINPVSVSIIAFAVTILAGLAVFFSRAKTGKAMRAVSQNQEAARLMGINVEWVFAATWALGTVIAALAGVLFAPMTGIHPEIGGLILKAFVAAVLGGFDSLSGAVVGGLLLGVVETYSGAFVGSTFKNVVAFAMLILTLIIRPNGLFGSKLSRRV